MLVGPTPLVGPLAAATTGTFAAVLRSFAAGATTGAFALAGVASGILDLFLRDLALEVQDGLLELLELRRRDLLRPVRVCVVRLRLALPRWRAAPVSAWRAWCRRRAKGELDERSLVRNGARHAELVHLRANVRHEDAFRHVGQAQPVRREPVAPELLAVVPLVQQHAHVVGNLLRRPLGDAVRAAAGRRRGRFACQPEVREQSGATMKKAPALVQHQTPLRPLNYRILRQIYL